MIRMIGKLLLFLPSIVMPFGPSALSFAQPSPSPRSRIVQAVDDARRITLAGNTHPLGRAEFDRARWPMLLLFVAWFWFSGAALRRKRSCGD